jgi:two-component system response regulator DegU
MGDNGHREIDREENGKLAVFIVDNQPLYRQAIREVLPDDMEVVGESELSHEIWSTIESLSPDIVLVDAGLPSLSGFGVARQIAIRCPGVGVVILSSKADDEQLFRALKSGAAAFVTKDISADNLVRLLRKVGQGTYPINETLLSQPGAANRILQLFRNLAMMGKDVERLITPLSPREGEILRHIAEGNSNKRIAYALGISEQTIKNYIGSIMRKLNANDRTHAVVLAMRKGWLNIEKTLDSRELEKELVSLK